MSDDAARRWRGQRTRKRRGETTDADTAFKEIRYSAERRLPSVKTRQMIATIFRKTEDISMPTCRVSLLCPLSKCRMSVAARGANCTHVQCFDLAKYLHFQVQNSLWTCPTCSKEVRQAHLRVDEYFCEVLKALGNRPEVTDVDLFPNGDYAPVDPDPVLVDVPDDGSPYVPDLVQPKREPLDATPEREKTALNDSGLSEAAAPDFIVINEEEPMVSDLPA